MLAVLNKDMLKRLWIGYTRNSTKLNLCLAHNRCHFEEVNHMLSIGNYNCKQMWLNLNSYFFDQSSFVGQQASCFGATGNRKQEG